MNVCLVTSLAEPPKADAGTPAAVASLGYRVVVLCMHPQRRRLWNVGPVVFAAPVAAGTGSTPWDVVYRRRLDALRRRWAPAVEQMRGKLAPVVRLVERQGYRVLRKGGTVIASRAETSLANLRARNTADKPADPLQALPIPARQFGLFHALDAGAVETARRAAAASGARYLGPELAGDVQATYENIIMHWLSV